jgi:hypothetical protein
MTNKKNTLKSIQEFRWEMEEAFRKRRDVMMNVIDALCVGPRIKTPVELSLSPVWKYFWASLYSGIRFGNNEEAESIKGMRKARIGWIEQWEEEGLVEKNERLGEWEVLVLDTTDYPRPKTETVKLLFAHSATGMVKGHNLSLLSQRMGAGSWCLPLEIALIDVGFNPGEFGARQVVDFVKRRGWQPESVLVVDAYYTKAPYLRPMREAGVNVMGRVAANRTFYLPPPPYPGRGRPAQKGRKIKLNNARTLPQADLEERVELEGGRYCEVSLWNEVKMKGWLSQPLVLYRVIEYRSDSTKRYPRPLWLIYVQAKGEIPTPAQGQAIYTARFSIEHSIRFLKQELGLVAGQFNGRDAKLRVGLWIELVAQAFWQLFAFKSAAIAQDSSLPPWWKNKKLTPGAVRRLALAIMVKFAIQRPKPKPRGKSPGRAFGVRFQPRWRFKIFKRRKRRPTR